ncbi:MAG: hypothetical protein ACLQVD_20680 [Capsulimonadaceae bacterium]
MKEHNSSTAHASNPALLAILVVALAVNAASAQSLSQPVAQSNGASFTMSRFVVDNMPLSVRNVPPNPGDASIATPGPINNTNYSNTTYSLSYSRKVVGLTCKTDSLEIDALANLDYYTSSFTERNYLGSDNNNQRGYGTALTFLFVRPRALLSAEADLGDLGGTGASSYSSTDGFGIGLSPEVEWVHAIAKTSTLFISATISKMDALTGWDRYDSLSVRNEQTLAIMYPVTIGYWGTNGDSADEGGSNNEWGAGVTLYPATITSTGSGLSMSGIGGQVSGRF